MKAAIGYGASARHSNCGVGGWRWSWWVVDGGGWWFRLPVPLMPSGKPGRTDCGKAAKHTCPFGDLHETVTVTEPYRPGEDADKKMAVVVARDRHLHQQPRAVVGTHAVDRLHRTRSEVEVRLRVESKAKKGKQKWKRGGCGLTTSKLTASQPTTQPTSLPTLPSQSHHTPRSHHVDEDDHGSRNPRLVPHPLCRGATRHHRAQKGERQHRGQHHEQQR